MEEGEDVFAVRKKYLEKDLPKPTLVEAFEMFIKNEKECFKGTEKELNEKTIQKWYYSRDHIKSFIGDKFKLRDIKKGFERKYFVHLLQSGKMGNNHAIRNVSYLNSVLDYCVMERFMEENPISLKTFLRDQPKPIVYLSEEQVSVVENIQSVDPYFNECRDIFLFMCYTSLDNNEIQKMDIEQHLEGNCIKITRGKTKHRSLQIIPLLPKTRLLLEKYNNKIPIHPTYRINRCLDVIETILKLNFNLSTKVGRKTAGMYFLINDVPLAVVSRILGHKSIVTTQKHYADVLDSLLVLKSTKHLMQ
ncbi:tyrosine-type recombinase/integrase [Flectobacillus longus]|uniref:tyrosine-type recombinase/integrase n=1 Tax=Flectobacillus longus TaxID=2984207 RepID=UPI0024B8208D|nr:phage integrase SAM-like domain-containing protein [Flectobacillus longus]MDI9878902.1 phage integrase SAM-like domain-containing protein [Flectobacillus longus]